MLAGLIFWLSGMSRPPIPGWLRFPQSDKLIHAVAFFSMAFLICMATTVRKRGFRLSVVIETMLIVVLYGLFDEFHQSHVPHRTPSVQDLIADIVGAATGTLAFGYLQMKVLFWYKKRRPAI